MEIQAVRCRSVERQAGRPRTGGYRLEGHIVEHQVDGRAGIQECLEGDVGARVCIACKGHLELLVGERGSCRGMHRVDRHKGGGIRRVGHHADHKVAVVAGVVLTCPETDLQGGNIQRGIHGGHNAVAIAAGTSIEVEAVGVVVAVGSGGIDVGAVGRAAQLVPARGEGGGTRAIALEVLGDGHSVNVGARCAERTSTEIAGVARSTINTDSYIIGGVGSESGQNERGVGGDAENSSVGHIIDNVTGTEVVGVNPSEGATLRVDIRSGEILYSIAGNVARHNLHLDVGHIGTSGAAATIGSGVVRVGVVAVAIQLNATAGNASVGKITGGIAACVFMDSNHQVAASIIRKGGVQFEFHPTRIVGRDGPRSIEHHVGGSDRLNVGGTRERAPGDVLHPHSVVVSLSRGIASSQVETNLGDVSCHTDIGGRIHPLREGIPIQGIERHIVRGARTCTNRHNLLCPGIPRQCHSHYRDQWHQKLVKSFHSVNVFVYNRVS